MITLKKVYVAIVFFFLFPTITYANFVWPAMYMIEDVYSWKIILLSTVIETLVIWGTVKQFSLYKSIIVSVVMNATSAVCGALLLPISGIIWEFIYGPIRQLIFDYGTFHWSTWISSFILAVFINTILECSSIRWIFKTKLSFKQKLYIFLVNGVTIVLAAIMVQQKHSIW